MTRIRTVRRSAAELHLLVESAQVAVVVVFLVDLATPWWTEIDPIEPVGTHTGWLAIGSAGGGYALASVVGIVLTAAALPFRRAWVSWAAAGLALVTGLLTLYNLNHSHSIRFGHAHAGAWCGCLLVALAAGLSAANAVLSSRRR